MKRALGMSLLLLLAPAAQGADIDAGKAKVASVCAACHGPTGVSVDLEAELADLEGEELEAELLAPTTTAPTTAPVRVPTAQQSTRPSAQSSKTEDDELAALQAEMAM